MPEHAFQHLGDSLTRALISGDFALYRSIMVLPLRIVPRGGQTYTLSTPAELVQDFDLYVASIRTSGVTDIWREVQDMHPEPGGGVRVVCRVHIMAQAHRVTDPFGSEMLLLPGDPGFRIAEIVSSAHHIDWTLGRGSLGPGSGLI